jgi:hypothetical protein
MYSTCIVFINGQSEVAFSVYIYKKVGITNNKVADYNATSTKIQLRTS